MQNNLVILRSCGGRPLIRRIFEVTEKAVYVTDDVRSDNLVSIGFHNEDVFQYNPQLAAKAEALYKSGKWDWKKLSPFKV